jgi:hypothetical protein
MTDVNAREHSAAHIGSQVLVWIVRTGSGLRSVQ